MNPEIIKAFNKWKEAYLAQNYLVNPLDTYCNSLGKMTGRERNVLVQEFRKNNEEFKFYIERTWQEYRSNNDFFKLISKEVDNIYQRYFKELNISDHFKLVENGDSEFDELIQPDNMLTRNDFDKYDYSTYECYFEILRGSLFDEYCDSENGVKSRSFLLPAENSEGDQSFYVCNCAIFNKENDEEPVFDNSELIHREDKKRFKDLVLFELREKVNNDIFFSDLRKLYNEFNKELITGILKEVNLDYLKLPQETKDIISKGVNGISDNYMAVPFFGDILNAKVCGLSLNPSNREFWDNQGSPLALDEQRFRKGNKTNEEVFESCLNYFKDHDTAYWKWFSLLSHLAKPFELPTTKEDLIKGRYVHFDHIFWATGRTWSELSAEERENLKSQSWDDSIFKKIFTESQVTTLIVTSVNEQDSYRARYLKAIAPKLFVFNKFPKKGIKISYYRNEWVLGRRITIIGINLSTEYLNLLAGIERLV